MRNTAILRYRVPAQTETQKGLDVEAPDGWMQRRGHNSFKTFSFPHFTLSADYGRIVLAGHVRPP